MAHKLHVSTATATGLSQTLPDCPGEATFLRFSIKHKRYRRGFTIVEAMTAAVVAGLAVTMFTAAFPSCSQWVLRSGHLDAATNGCARQAEYWRGVGYNAITAIPPGESTATQTWTPPSELPNATAQTVFTYLDSSMSPTTVSQGRCKVEVTVTWTGNGGDKGSVSVVGVVTR